MEAQFIEITQASPETAAQFLAQAEGNLDNAIALFFAAGEEPVDQEDIMQESKGSSSQQAAPAAPAEPARRVAPTASSSGPRIGTLGGLASRDSDSDDEDPKRNLFAGGEKSGLSVQDPSAGKKGEDVRKDLLQKAQEGSLKRQKLQAQAPPAPASSSFGGSGNTLGSEEAPSVHVPDPTAPKPRATMPGSLGEGEEGGEEQGEDDEDAQVTRTLTFWRNGFSIDDGPLMNYEEHREVLEQLRDGRAPLSLLGVRFGQRVDVHIANRETEEYVAPPKVTKPFGGEGNRLGAPSPAVTSAASASSSARAPASHPPSQTKFEVDPNKPTTQLQIRLADGTRVIGRFNHDHAVADVQSYINASHAGLATRPYVLQTTFPTRDLTDLSQTIKDANLLGSVVVMRYQ